ncbi:MAG TPA: DUF1572 family protein [Gemmatimonadales bacterium]|nr:DUF1572 family protein [Gemmatimonadales bacterium]
MRDEIGAAYLADALRVLRQYKDLGERAMAQVPQEGWFHTLDPESNSIAVLVKHLAGNMRSRWTDFLTSDGEKPDRNRDAEFETESGTTGEDVRRWWEEGWRAVFAAVEPLGPADLLRTVSIRGKPLSVLEAIDRQIAHYAYHVGQIVLLAKHLSGGRWETLSLPKRRAK